jgi:hypothetical protein
VNVQQSFRVSGVLVTPRVAVRLDRLLRSELDRLLRRDGVRPDPEVVQFARDVATVANAYRLQVERELEAQLSSEPIGTSGIPDHSPGRIMQRMPTAAVAKLLECSPRNVTALSERGTLTGQRIGRGLVFDRVDVLEYMRARSSGDA